MEDSFIGFDQFGRSVPDLNFPEDMRYGLENRPRQSMFKNRIDALAVLITFINTRLLEEPYATQVDLTLLNAKDPVPNILLGEYDRIVDSEVDIDYINVETLTAGFKVLVEVDSLARGWVIYEYDGSKFNRSKTQTFDKVTGDTNVCDLPTVHSRFQANNLKEMGINRWENLKYNPQKYAIAFEGRFNNNNINSRQLIKDEYKPLDIKPQDHTNELEVSNKVINEQTNPVTITPFQDQKKNEYL